MHAHRKDGIRYGESARYDMRLRSTTHQFDKIAQPKPPCCVAMDLKPATLQSVPVVTVHMLNSI